MSRRAHLPLSASTVGVERGANGRRRQGRHAQRQQRYVGMGGLEHLPLRVAAMCRTRGDDSVRTRNSAFTAASVASSDHWPVEPWTQSHYTAHHQRFVRLSFVVTGRRARRCTRAPFLAPVHPVISENALRTPPPAPAPDTDKSPCTLSHAASPCPPPDPATAAFAHTPNAFALVQHIAVSKTPRTHVT